MRAAIVIPALNEAETIGAVVQQVSAYGLPVVVDNGSTDGTGAEAAKAGADVIRHERNKGYDGALESGFARAAVLGVDTIVSFDADGQLDRRAIPRALDAIGRDAVMLVLGVRRRPARFAEWLFNLYARLRFGVPDILCGLKAFRTEAYARHREIMRRGDVNTRLALTLLREGARFAMVEVAVAPRGGVSRFGGAWRANKRLLGALLGAIGDDMRRRNPRS